MSQSKNEAIRDKVADLVKGVIDRESIPSNSQSYDDLQWVLFHVRDLTAQCKDCADKEAPSGSKNEN